MKNLALLLLIGFAIALTSCEPKAPEPTGKIAQEYFFKKIDGKILTGVRNTKQHGISPGEIRIQAEYESIELGFEDRFYIASRNNKKDIYDYSGKKIVSSANSFELIDKRPHGGICFQEGAYYKIFTDGGVIGLIGNKTFGPYKDFVPGLHGYIYEDSKGINYVRYYKSDPGFILEGYDQISEITVSQISGGWIHARKGSREFNADFNGHDTKKYQPAVNRKIANMPFTNHIVVDALTAISMNINGPQKFGNNKMNIILLKAH